jgi:hypothetical protein
VEIVIGKGTSEQPVNPIESIFNKN